MLTYIVFIIALITAVSLYVFTDGCAPADDAPTRVQWVRKPIAHPEVLGLIPVASNQNMLLKSINPAICGRLANTGSQKGNII